jgi:hypothetical protein
MRIPPLRRWRRKLRSILGLTCALAWLASSAPAGAESPAWIAALGGSDHSSITLSGWLAPDDGIRWSAPPLESQEHWSSLPFLGEQARQRGYRLPLPFGVTGVYNYLARDVDVTDVRVGVNGAPVTSASDVVTFKARSFVDAAVVKADAWIFPFLDVYVLLGYIKNTTELNVEVTVPRPGPLPGTRQFTIATKAELEGFVGGGGFSLAGGYRQLFAMMDVNYTQTELGFDNRFRALIASGRVGWNGTVGPLPMRLWVGGAFWDTKNTASSTVDVPGVGVVRFEADQKPTHPWNAVVGASAVVHRHLDLFAEYGFNPGDVTFFAGGLTFRF